MLSRGFCLECLESYSEIRKGEVTEADDLTSNGTQRLWQGLEVSECLATMN